MVSRGKEVGGVGLSFPPPSPLPNVHEISGRCLWRIGVATQGDSSPGSVTQ